MGRQEREPVLMPADFLIGERVVDPQGEDLGRIEELMVDAAAGQVRYAIVSFGGVFGLGEKLFAIPWGMLQPDPENRRFLLAASREQLKGAPAFDRHSWPEMSRDWERGIHRYYEQPPYWEIPGPGGLPANEPADPSRRPPRNS